MSYRFAAPELLRLGPPPKLAARDHESLRTEALTDLIARFNAAGIPYDTGKVAAEPAHWYALNAAERDMLRRYEIDDAVAQSYLGSATGAHLDARAADYGVLRRQIAYTGQQAGSAEPLRPANVPPLWTWHGSERVWREDDESLRIQARLAWEALSVAGPPGAYLFHAGQAHPMIAAGKSAVYGPESGLVEPGEVLIVVRSHSTSSVPSLGQIDSVAARLDAAEVRYSTGATVMRPVRDEQSVRPLGARVIVEACKPITFYVSAKLFVRPGPDPEAIRQTAIARVNAYLASRRAIAAEVPMSGLIAALHVAGPDGLPVVEEVELVHPITDVLPAHNELATASVVTVTIEVR